MVVEAEKLHFVKGYCDWGGLREIFVTFLVRQPTIALAFLATTSHPWLISGLQSTKIPKSFTHTALKPCFSHLVPVKLIAVLGLKVELCVYGY